MGVSRGLRSKWREQIPTRFALASKATSPFQGEVGARELFKQETARRVIPWAVPFNKATNSN